MVFLNDGSQEYKFVGEGAHVSPEAQQELLKLLETLPDFDYFTINGSLPPPGWDGPGSLPPGGCPRYTARKIPQRSPARRSPSRSAEARG